jgi:DnaJ-class molecular chaperone
MSRSPAQSGEIKDIRMDFGKRFSVHNDRAPPVAQQTCVRCCGTGRVRERGERIVCKACAGTGRINIKTDRAS